MKKVEDHCHRSKIKFFVVLRESFDRTVSEYVEWKLYLKYHSGKTFRNFETLSIKKSAEVNKFHSQVKARDRGKTTLMITCNKRVFVTDKMKTPWKQESYVEHNL